jgi:dTDP-glucose 4,6-dehydratase
LHKGREGEVYNIGGGREEKNIDIVKAILRILKKPETMIKYVKDRPAHDRRYALDSSKIKREMGWEPEYSFEKGISGTIKWYIENEDWWRRIKTGDYLDYYQRMYGNR